MSDQPELVTIYKRQWYQCERCGGSGLMQAGTYWNPDTKKYDIHVASRTTCTDCDGKGGWMADLPWITKRA